jgi:hypothetical protein
VNTDPEYHKLYVQRLPTSAEARKNVPIATGCIDYFPDAIAAVAELSKKGNEQHHPGQPLHWDRSKSTDEADALMRHFVERGTLDTDGIRHSAKVAWRALALLQKEIERERELQGQDSGDTQALRRAAPGRVIYTEGRPNHASLAGDYPTTDHSLGN